MKRTGSSFHQLRKRVPSDLIGRTDGVVLAIPVGAELVTKRLTTRTREITLSLRTYDAGVAKRRQAVAYAYLEGEWERLRNGPAPLTHKQTVALAGKVYRRLSDAFEDNPGTPGRWSALLLKITQAQAGQSQPLQIGQNRAATLEKALGPVVDLVLAEHSLSPDEESRRSLIERAASAAADAAFKLWRNAEGDYRPDPIADTFPPVELPVSSNRMPTIVRDWWREAKAGGLSPNTHVSYLAVSTRLVTFLGHDDATRITPEDIVRFKDARLADGLSIKTIRDSDLAGLRSLFQWAVDNRRLRTNPAEGVKVRGASKKPLRSKDFTESEARTILTLSLTSPRGRQNAKTYAAKRWAPWLMAYSGARVGEIGQLRKRDIIVEDGIHTLVITPDAGTVKDGRARKVPIHAHLVEMGFLDFVAKSAKGHLFINPGRGGNILGPLQGLTNRLSEFARTVVSDKGVSPNHGWRHRFKTVGREVGIADSTLDAIAGHAAPSVGRGYGEVSLKTKAMAIAKLPRYTVTADN